MPWELIGNAGTNPANNFLGTTDNQPLAIRINNVESIRATPGGNVGIGTTNPITAVPGGRALHIDNPTGASVLRLGDGAANGQQWEWQSTVVGNVGAMILTNVSALTLGGPLRPLTVLESGNVGIGTSQPTQTLTLGSGNISLPNAYLGERGNLYFGGITDAGQTGLRLFGGRVNPGPNEIHAGFIDVRTDTATDGLRIRVDTGDGGTERMRVTAGGNVGIGMVPSMGPASPLMPAGDVKLDVKNDIFAGSAIRGEAQSFGVVGTAGAYAVYGYTNPDTGTSGVGVYGRGGQGVFGRSVTGDAVYGYTNTGNGVKGESDGNLLTTAGVYGVASGVNSIGVIGEANTGGKSHGVWGKSTTGYAGYFSGIVYVAGNLWKGNGGFKIDHPLDPENKYLYHSFVESPDRLNVYSGNVTTDTNGDATVTLPDYFEALNQDFRYQLSVIGQFAQAIVAEEVRDNQFTIKTDRPQVKVSWQVTGARKDAFARMHPFLVEEDKPADESGTYLHPEAHGKPETQGVDYTREKELKENQTAVPDRNPLVPAPNSDQQP